MKVYDDSGLVVAGDLDRGELFETEGFDGAEPEASLRFRLTSGQIVEFAGSELMDMVLCAAGRS